MLHAYQSPPLFIDDVQQPLGAADLNVLRNNAVLLDAASFILACHTKAVREGIPVRPGTMWASQVSRSGGAVSSFRGHDHTHDRGLGTKRRE